MSPDLLYLAADATAFLGKLSALVILGGILAGVAIVLVHAATDRARRTLDFVTWGECPRCGKDDCWCDRDGNGWRDLMDAARDEEHDFAACEQIAREEAAEEQGDWRRDGA